MSFSACFSLLLVSTSIGAYAQPQLSKANAGSDYSKEAYVLEQSSDKFKFENDGRSTREMRMRVRIQSDAGVQSFSVVKFAYQNSSEVFAIDYVRVTKPDATVVVTPPDTFQDMPADITRQAPFYTDTHETDVAVKGLSVGDILEYQAHWHQNKPLIPGQFWLDYNFAHDGIVLQELVEVSLPHGREIKLKSPAIKPVITQSGQYDVYTWTSSNLENKDEKKEKQKQPERSWQQVRGRLPHVDMQLSSFKSWEELGNWYQTLQSDRVKPSAEIQAKAAELTRGSTDENAKIHVLYDFVSTKYRYIGISFGLGRYQPHAATEVLANQYGDCKDKHTLFASLLNAAGIKAYPALISSVHDIDTEVPSPGQFNHVITAIPQGTGFLWLDTTAEVAPFALLLPPLRDKRALVIAGDKPPMLVETPADDPFPTLQKFDIQAKLSDAGVLEGKAESTNRGDIELLFRAGFRSVPLSQWKDLMQRVAYMLGFSGDVSDVNASQPEKTAEPFHFSYTYERKDYSDWSNRRIVAPLPTITLPELDDEIAPTVPVWLGSPGEIYFHSTLELPKGYSPDLPKEIHIKRDFADYDATYSFQSGVITTERHMAVKLREVPVSEYADYKSFRKTVEDDHNTYISLSMGRRSRNAFDYQSEIWDLPYSKNSEASRLYDNARAQYQQNDTQGEIASLKQAVEIDSKFMRARLWLGEIYRASGQFDMAVQSYRKAIEIDPEPPVSYKALAVTLAMMKKTDEAIAVWQQLTKIAPNLVDGYGNWGGLLLFQKRYRDAIVPLESAVKLNPEEPGLQISLGTAYMHEGEIEKARGFFQKAIALDSSAMMLNNIAYLCADQNIDLDNAKEYAMKAVSQEEDESTKTELSTLQKGDLDHPQRLAMFWDTLGWAYYRLNDLSSAETYLEAAWVLSQRPIIGEHLGRVYEKQGRKQQAIRTFQLAYAASPTVWMASPQGVTPAGADASLIEQDLNRMGAAADRGLMSDLSELRTVKLPRLVSGAASAEFFLMFGPGNKMEVKFISGADSLKGVSKALQSAKFNVPLPDQRPMHILRRGILGCYSYSGCSFVMMNPATVASIE